MNTARLLRLSVTVHRVTSDGAADEMGDPTDTEVSTTYNRAGYVWQTSRNDETANTDVQQEEWRGVFHRRLLGEFDGADAITVEGRRFELDGPPWPARNPRTDRIEYLEAELRRTL